MNQYICAFVLVVSASVSWSNGQDRILEDDEDFRFEWSDASRIEFSKDGTFLALKGYKHLGAQRGHVARIWDVENGNVWVTVGNAASVQFTPSGKRIAVAQSNCIAMWDLQAKKETDRIPVKMKFHEMAFLKGGSLLACAAPDGSVRIFDVVKKAEVTVLRGHLPRRGPLGSAAFVTCLAVSLNGNYLATGGSDGRVLLWSTQTWNELGASESQQDDLGPLRLRTVAFWPDDKTLIYLGPVLGAAKVFLWDVDKKQDLPRIELHRYRVAGIHDMALSPDRRTVALVSSRPYLFDVATQEEVGHKWGIESPREEFPNFSKEVSVTHYRVAFSPDGRWLGLASVELKKDAPPRYQIKIHSQKGN